ncbi:MAG: hypothetical protein WCS01_12970 [bacterium]
MPKVTGPLFSLSASGTFMGAMEFRKCKEGWGVVAKMRTRRKPRTSSQILHNQQWSSASAAWSGLLAEEKTTWQDKAKTSGYKTGFMLWISEWFTQRIQSPERPLLPA